MAHRQDQGKTKEQLIQELEELREKLSLMKERESAFKAVEEHFRKELVEYEKLSALGRLAANVAHEIRNPVTVIGGLARRLKKSALQGSEETEYLDLMISEAQRLETILKEILSFSDDTASQREKGNMNEIVQEQLDFFETVCSDRSIEVRKSLRDVPLVYIDKKQVMEAVRNVISNAIDALPEGGVMTLSTGTDSFHGRHYVVLKVTDTGIGIPEENTVKIFEPFFTTKAMKKETGLGLPITRKILEKHGGFIKVDSRVGKGATFSLYFPYRSD